MPDSNNKVAAFHIIESVFELTKKIYNLSYYDFKDLFEEALGYEVNEDYAQKNFDSMRRDFWQWWVNLDSKTRYGMSVGHDDYCIWLEHKLSSN